MCKNALKNEDGAVTVDWVVLTAGLVGLGLATMSVVSGGVQDLTQDTTDVLTEADNRRIIRTSFDPIALVSFDGEASGGVSLYGETGSTMVLSDALGAVSGAQAYVVTTAPQDDNGVMQGGVYINVPDDNFVEGGTYRVSYWARAESTPVAVTAFNYKSGGGDTGLGWPTTSVGTEWTYVEHEFTPSEYSQHLYIASLDVDVTFAVDDIKYELMD